MTNINCSKSCMYQQDGKCCYDRVTMQSPLEFQSADDECLYFRKQPKKQAEHTEKTNA